MTFNIGVCSCCFWQIMQGFFRNQSCMACTRSWLPHSRGGQRDIGIQRPMKRNHCWRAAVNRGHGISNFIFLSRLRQEVPLMWQSHVSLIYCTLVSVKQAPWNLSRMRLLQSGAARLEVFRSVSHTVLSSSPSLPKAVFHSSTSSQIFIEASLSNTCHGDTTLRVAPTTKTPQPLHITGPRSISRPLEFEEVPLWALLHLAFSMEAVQCWKKKRNQW